MECQLEMNCCENLQCWKNSGQPRRWIEDHQGQWNHQDWLSLLETLRQSDCWPLQPEAVGTTLEEMKKQWRNLRCWSESGQPRQWVEDHQGQWNHGDWLALLDNLHQSEYWPMNPDDVGRILELRRREQHNLRRWQGSSLPATWVEEHQGIWNHGDWLCLVDSLKESAYWPIDMSGAAIILEDLKSQYANLRRWQESGQARRWVEDHEGEWNHADWLELLESLQQSIGSLQPQAVGKVLEQLKAERLNLRHWQESGQAWAWVESHQGRWNHADWLELLDSLRASAFWPLQPEAVGVVMEEERKEWLNLHRWQTSNQPRQWVESRSGRWNHDHWLSLLDALKRSEYWPIHPPAVGRILEEIAPVCNGLAA